MEVGLTDEKNEYHKYAYYMIHVIYRP